MTTRRTFLATIAGTVAGLIVPSSRTVAPPFADAAHWAYGRTPEGMALFLFDERGELIWRALSPTLPEIKLKRRILTCDELGLPRQPTTRSEVV